MKLKGRFVAVIIVGLFNILRYFYYNVYVGLPFQMNFFVLTAIFLSIAWWCGKHYDRAEYFSKKDPLTDTFNRRQAEQYFEKFTSKDDKKLGVLMIDLDDFKNINDTYGHLTGDEVLINFAMGLKKVVAKKDLIVRWGGDEFMILVPYLSKDFNMKTIEALEEAIKKIRSSDLSPIGVSVGFALYPDDGDTFQQLIQEADRYMYKRKGNKLQTSETLF